MIIHCKETLGDGTIRYKDYEVPDPVPPEDEPTVEAKAEAYDILMGVDSE